MNRFFANLPVGDRWELSAADIAIVAARYGLSDYRIGPPPPAGAVNGLARIDSEGRGWIIRVHRPWTDPARLAGVHLALDALRAEGHPIPPVLRDAAGATFTRLADRLIEVIEFVPHEATVRDWDGSRAAFGTLGTLQGSFARIAPNNSLPDPRYSSYATPEDALAMIEETEWRFGTLASAPDYPRAARAREATRSLLERLATERRRYESALSLGFVHGDYGGDNVLLAGGRVVAILDFDFMARRERIFDLAYGAYWALDRFGQRDKVGAISPDDLDQIGILLRSYQQNTTLPLNSAEIAALPLEMARVPLYWLAEAGYLGESPADTRPIEQTLRFARHIPIARQLIDNADRIARRFSRAID